MSSDFTTFITVFEPYQDNEDLMKQVLIRLERLSAVARVYG